ncbi:MAG: manganese efflux pump [Thermoflavifilum sp.]|nr:manganese efflux pump [Thermoflavifilum sp.]MCL6513176.1 manganese efflux pump MntP family protein [Alicyclobacillus sp.]
MMSLALGMDALSLSLGIGMQGISRRRAVVLALLIAVFHFGLTYVGLLLGAITGELLGQVARWFGALLLMGLGLHMMVSTLFVKQPAAVVGSTLPAMLAFSTSVSVDALSVGFSLGLRSATYGFVSAASFALFGGAMCLMGLVIGRGANAIAGMWGELLGAAILVGYGVHFLWT